MCSNKQMCAQSDRNQCAQANSEKIRQDLCLCAFTRSPCARMRAIEINICDRIASPHGYVAGIGQKSGYASTQPATRTADNLIFIHVNKYFH